MLTILKKTTALTVSFAIACNSWGQAVVVDPPATTASAAQAPQTAASSPVAAMPELAASAPQATASSPATLPAAPSTDPTPIIIRTEYTLAAPDGSRFKAIPDEVNIVTRESVQKGAALQIGLAVLTLFTLGGAGVGAMGKESKAGVPIAASLTNRQNVVNSIAKTYPQVLQNAVNVALKKQANLAQKSYKNPLLVTGSARLIYESLSGDPEIFQLYTDLTVYKDNEKRSFFGGRATPIDCSVKTPEKAIPLESWAANDYALVKSQLDLALQKCTDQVIAALPQLLKE